LLRLFNAVEPAPFVRWPATEELVEADIAVVLVGNEKVRSLSMSLGNFGINGSPDQDCSIFLNLVEGVIASFPYVKDHLAKCFERLLYAVVSVILYKWW
jgi:hypothetical protein